MQYEVLDLGSHEILARFQNKRHADAWALTISAYGPAVQVLPVKEQPMLKWVEEAAKGATMLKDKFDAFNTLRQLTALDKRVTDMPEVKRWIEVSGADVVKGIYCVK